MKNVKGLGSIGVFLGIFLSRFLGAYFGLDATIMVLSVCILFFIGSILYLLIIGKFLAAIAVLLMSIPLVTGTLGVYLDNSFLQCGSILSIFTILPIMKLMKKFVERKRK